MSTKYKFTGNQQEYEATLRQFTLDELLKCINRESVHLLYDKGKIAEILKNGQDY